MLEEMIKSYTETMLWASVDDNDEPFDENYTDDDLAQETRQKIRDDCQAFLAEAGETTLCASSIGHDFWLTRNRYGAGFWDRGLGTEGERLTALAHAFGGQVLYVGDDDMLYLG